MGDLLFVGLFDAAAYLPDVPGYVDFPGSAGNYLSTPDATALDIAGDLCIVTKLAADNYATGLYQCIVTKSTITYRLFIGPTGELYISWYHLDGTTFRSAQSTAMSSVITGLTGGQPIWIAVTVDVDNGASGSSTRFWVSSDTTDDPTAVTWTQLGSTNTIAGISSFYNSTTSLEMGGEGAGVSYPFGGNVKHLSVRNGVGAGGVVGGTEVFKFGPENIPINTANSFVAATGQTVTVNRSAGEPKTLLVPTDRHNMPVLFGTAGPAFTDTACTGSPRLSATSTSSTPTSLAVTK
ncbi:MAG: hypothetical protein WKH64_12640 [Chloroflexia bacterium]